MRFALKPNRRIEKNAVFIGGLVKGAWDEQRIGDVFSQHGAIDDIKIMDNRTSLFTSLINMRSFAE
jgi:hypothetical protein